MFRLKSNIANQLRAALVLEDILVLLAFITIFIYLSGSKIVFYEGCLGKFALAVNCV